MYLIKKTLYGNSYWWNERQRKWEGLKNNATPLTETTFEFRWGKFTIWEIRELTFQILPDKGYPL